MCVCVCYHLSINIVRFYGLSKVRVRIYMALLGFSFLTRGFKNKHSVQKLCHVKANIQMTIHRWPPVLAEYRAYISKYMYMYLQAVH